VATELLWYWGISCSVCLSLCLFGSLLYSVFVTNKVNSIAAQYAAIINAQLDPQYSKTINAQTSLIVAYHDSTHLINYYLFPITVKRGGWVVPSNLLKVHCIGLDVHQTHELSVSILLLYHQTTAPTYTAKWSKRGFVIQLITPT